ACCSASDTWPDPPSTPRAGSAPTPPAGSAPTPGRRCKGIGPPVRIWGVEQDRTDFAAFYAATRDDCLRIVLVNVGDQDLADDLVAEGFTRAWISWPKVRQHPVPHAWVIRTALNAHVSWWRRRRREVALDGYDAALAAGSAGT